MKGYSVVLVASLLSFTATAQEAAVKMAPMQMPAMQMPPMQMQGGKPSSDARDPDYSDGVPASTLRGMDMLDATPQAMLLIDQLETTTGHNGSGKAWDVEGWYGGDTDRLWVRTEGDGTTHSVEQGNVDALWYRTVSAYWGTQLGFSQDLGRGEHRQWAAVGVEGLAPYWFEIRATAYVGASGRTALKLHAEYELLLTQRLVLQPEAEMSAYGKSDRSMRTGAGVSDVTLGIRLRYEIRRWFAPYIGVQFQQQFGGTASYARSDREAVFDRQWVAGIRVWF